MSAKISCSTVCHTLSTDINSKCHTLSTDINSKCHTLSTDIDSKCHKRPSAVTQCVIHTISNRHRKSEPVDLTQ